MMQSIYTAKLGILAQQQRVDTIANNIANISTHSFKNKRVDFKDALYSEMQNPILAEGAVNLRQGNGVHASASSCDFSQGSTEFTGEVLDMLIDGDGFFTVTGSNGELQYTRNGNFKISSEADGQYLVTAQGYYVMDKQLNRIQLPGSTKDLSVTESGELFIGNNPSFAAMSLVTFANRNGLSSAGNNCYVTTDASGDIIASDAKIKQGALETSNVDISLEMTRLIRAQRAFSLAGKALTAADDMEAIANNIRR